MNSGVGQSKSLGDLNPFAPVASSSKAEVISHGPIFNTSDTFIDAMSQMGEPFGCHVAGQQFFSPGTSVRCIFSSWTSNYI